MIPCRTCGRETFPLFVTTVCEWCEGTGTFELDRGFVVWPGDRDVREVYVFKSERDARVWRDANSVHRWPIREVLSDVPFRWRRSTGSLQGIELADHLFEIHPDRFFPRGPYRAFLAADVLEEAS